MQQILTKTFLLIKLYILSYCKFERVSTFIFRPYPSWEMQKIGRCSSFQFVQSMEIDPEGRMWMADNGYVGNTKNPLCPPKLYIIDLKTDKIVKVSQKYLRICIFFPIFDVKFDYGLCHISNIFSF